MLQELLARDLGVPLGRYKHAAGSLHLYDTEEAKAREFLEEGWQDIIEMPPMPSGNQWAAIETLKSVEETIRAGSEVDIDALGLDTYWTDIARALKIFALTKGSARATNQGQVDSVAKAMSSDFFRPYISDRKKQV